MSSTSSSSKVINIDDDDSQEQEEDEEMELEDCVSSLYNLLNSSIPHNDFTCSGIIESVPIIDIGRNYTVKFPCVDDAARGLIEHCEEAPFGLGANTVHDKNVRNGWQLANNAFTVRSAQWKKLEKDSKKSDILDTVRQSLAPDCEQIRSELYKLLVYEKGNHFKPHKDTQRSENHFATLLVFLPSVYKGGDLVVRHRGKERRFHFSMSKAHPMRCHYVAFFADCEHEVEPVTSGHRLTLQYNLTFEGTRRPTPPTADVAEKCDSMIDAVFEHDEFADTIQRKNIAYVCSHQYSIKSLSPRLLKGSDRYIYQTLQALRKYRVDLVPIEITASGQAGDDEAWDPAIEYLRECITEGYSPSFSVREVDQNNPPSKKRSRYSFFLGSGSHGSLMAGFSEGGSYNCQDEGDTLFLNDIADLSLKLNPFDSSKMPTGNEGTEVELQYLTAAILIKRKEDEDESDRDDDLGSESASEKDQEESESE